MYGRGIALALRRVTLHQVAVSMDACPAGNLVAIGTRDRVIKLIDFQQATLQVCDARSSASIDPRCCVTVAQDHVAPLGSQECLAFSHDASMISCVCNTEVSYCHRLARSCFLSSHFVADLDLEYAPIGGLSAFSPALPFDKYMYFSIRRPLRPALNRVENPPKENAWPATTLTGQVFCKPDAALRATT
jgi:hypothetical protein